MLKNLLPALPKPTTNLRPLPPPPPAQPGKATMGTHAPPPRSPPPPQLRDAFSIGTSASMSNSLIGLPAPTVNPAFVKNVTQMGIPELQKLSSQLKMEVLIARFTGNPQAENLAKQKLNIVDGRIGQVKQQQADAAQMKGMSNQQLETTRSQTMLQMFSCTLRGDTSGASAAREKLGQLDTEINTRKSELSQFQASLGEMSPEQLQDLGEDLATQLFKLLFDPKATDAQKDSAFNRFGSVLGEQVMRDIKNSANDWLFSK